MRLIRNKISGEVDVIGGSAGHCLDFFVLISSNVGVEPIVGVI
jgi:hypothetical protein